MPGGCPSTSSHRRSRFRKNTQPPQDRHCRRRRVALQSAAHSIVTFSRCYSSSSSAFGSPPRLCQLDRRLVSVHKNISSSPSVTASQHRPPPRASFPSVVVSPHRRVASVPSAVSRRVSSAPSVAAFGRSVCVCAGPSVAQPSVAVFRRPSEICRPHRETLMSRHGMSTSCSSATRSTASVARSRSSATPVATPLERENFVEEADMFGSWDRNEYF
ncbi:JmjC domain-containing histone demethylation protein 1 [Striga asiatica]|uniref:JmjC domain-containing histone demethylation protein 1 n=1 Tax=Striga asiatica TaxID=4170 RepID=A0A5A7PQA2_STRAF|nr:JmjC domain-containing histone demethylation protein 1 [Striga asiatica]